MIVDDKDIVRRELKRLKIWGDSSGFVIVQEASNGQEALDMMAKNHADLIITDIKMPKIDGIELLRVIVERKLCSCVVLLSDYSEFSYARQGIILGAFDYMPKPVNEQELVALLNRAREYLDQSNSEKERVKQLEQYINENNEGHIPALNIDKIIELMKTRDQNLMDCVRYMIDQLGKYYKADFNSFENSLQESLRELVKILINYYHFLEMYIGNSQFHIYRFNTDQDFETVKELFLVKLNEIISLLEVLRCCVLENEMIGQVCRYIIEHVEDDISLTIVADQLFMNKTYLSEMFKQKVGISFTEYVTSVKMERAKLIIIQSNLKSFEIAEKLGFKDCEYFSKVFKKYTGMTPTDFRKKTDK
jgi:Response regulator containing CheY-like receiver domain and AraC-type DNA-binding domain